MKQLFQCEYCGTVYATAKEAKDCEQRIEEVLIARREKNLCEQRIKTLTAEISQLERYLQGLSKKYEI